MFNPKPILFFIADGTGYIEDGREVFDEEEVLLQNNKASKSNTTGKKRLRDNISTKGKSSIKNLFGKAVPKRQEVYITILKCAYILNFSIC